MTKRLNNRRVCIACVCCFAAACVLPLPACGLVTPGGGIIGDDPYSFSQDIETLLAARVATEPLIDIPYLGTLVAPNGRDAGVVLMSTCGCGFWRAYTEVDDDRLLSRMDFEDFPHSFAEFYTGESEAVSIIGQFEDEGMRAFGELSTGRTRARFLADALTDRPNYGCVACHVGDDPPLPLPDTHRVVDEATNCLGCHETIPH